MKKLSVLFLVAIVIMFAACTQPHANDNFNIQLTLTGAGTDTIYLKQRVDGEMVTFDSAAFVGDKAQLWGSVEMPEFFYLTFGKNKGYIPLFVEQGDNVLAGDYLDLENVTFSGSLSQDNLVAFNMATQAFDDQMSELGQQYGQARQLGDTTRMNAIEAEYMSLDEQKTDYVTQYAFDHPDQVLSAYIILSNSYQYELDMLDSLTMAFAPEISNSIYVKKLQEHVATLKRSAVGQPFIDFTMDDINGNPIMLSSVVGKNYVLVDFWASWCSPCRAENPNVVAAYEKYHDKGFDVYGVSFDKDHDGWINAIADDQLAWTQVSDLKYWNCAAGKLYGIQSIPQNILISPEGIIIEKNLRGEDLHLKLQELLD